MESISMQAFDVAADKEDIPNIYRFVRRGVSFISTPPRAGRTKSAGPIPTTIIMPRLAVELEVGYSGGLFLSLAHWKQSRCGLFPSRPLLEVHCCWRWML